MTITDLVLLPVFVRKAAHDVSDEARDEKGKWTTGTKVYRGVSTDGESITRSGQLGNGMLGKGVYTSTSRSDAEVWASDGGKVMSGVVSPDAKLIEADDAPGPFDPGGEEYRSRLDWAEANGYHGMTITGAGKGKWVVLRDPSMVKWDKDWEPEPSGVDGDITPDVVNHFLASMRPRDKRVFGEKSVEEVANLFKKGYRMKVWVRPDGSMVSVSDHSDLQFPGGPGGSDWGERTREGLRRGNVRAGVFYDSNPVGKPVPFVFAHSGPKPLTEAQTAAVNKLADLVGSKKPLVVDEWYGRGEDHFWADPHDPDAPALMSDRPGAYYVSPTELPDVAGWEKNVGTRYKVKDFAAKCNIAWLKLSTHERSIVKGACPKTPPIIYSSTIKGTKFNVTFERGLDPNDADVTPEKITDMLHQITSLASKVPVPSAAWEHGGPLSNPGTVEISVGWNPAMPPKANAVTSMGVGRIQIQPGAFGMNAQVPVAVHCPDGWIPKSIQDQWANSPTLLEYTLTHEWGHLVDKMPKNVAKKLYATNPSIKAISGYSKTDAEGREAIAEAFAEYVFNPGKMSDGAKIVAQGEDWS